MAAQNVSGTVNVNVGLVEQITSGLVTPASLAATGTYNKSFSYATGGAGNLDTIYAAQISLAASATQLDLYSGQTDPFGNSISFARVRVLFVQIPTDTTAGHVVKVYSQTNVLPWLGSSTAPNIVQPNGGFLLMVDYGQVGATTGYYVTNSLYNVTLDPGSNTVLVNVIIAGNSVNT